MQKPTCGCSVPNKTHNTLIFVSTVGTDYVIQQCDLPLAAE